MKETIHHAQFSTGFDGWQLANNGLHVLPFIEDGQQPDNKRLREFHQIMQHQFKDIITEKTDSGRIATAAFLWDKEGPLKQYLFYYMQTTRTPYPIAWARLGGGLYADYGKWLIMHYPILFWQHYLAPNCKDVFYTTRLEMAGKYTEIPIGQKEMATWSSRGLRGSTLEELINTTNEIYARNKLALIQKVPTPITPINIDKD